MGLEIFDMPDEFSQEDLDRSLSGNTIPPGRYLARVADVKETASKEKHTPGIEFVFVIIGGDLDGKEVKETLWLTGNLENRKRLFSCCLGIHIKVGDKYVRNPKIASWVETIGEEVVIEVVNEEYTKSDGTTGKRHKLAFKGLHDRTTPTGPPSTYQKKAGGDGARAADGPARTMADGASAAAPPARKKVDTSKL